MVTTAIEVTARRIEKAVNTIEKKKCGKGVGGNCAPLNTIEEKKCGEGDRGSYAPMQRLQRG
jgi:hypothetical protein